jgi:hypothetical protein
MQASRAELTMLRVPSARAEFVTDSSFSILVGWGREGPTVAMSIHEDFRMDSKAQAPDPAKLVERLQSLKMRLANMAQTLENSVAASTPVKGSISDEIMYSTPKVVKEFLEGPVPKDFVSSDYVATEGEQIIEIRYTISASNQEEVDRIVSEIRQKPDIKPTTLTYQ